MGVHLRIGNETTFLNSFQSEVEVSQKFHWLQLEDMETFWKNYRVNRSVPINRTVSFIWNQRIADFKRLQSLCISQSTNPHISLPSFYIPLLRWKLFIREGWYQMRLSQFAWWLKWLQKINTILLTFLTRMIGTCRIFPLGRMDIADRSTRARLANL